MVVNLKAVAQDLVSKGKYPKKDGGVTSLSGDQGDIIVMREGNVVTYQFAALGKQVKMNIGGASPAPPAKPAVPPKKVASLAPAKKEPAIPEPPKEPVWVEQMGYDRQVEQVDLNLHPNIVTCACGNIRYVANGDMHQVTECKPCTRLHRRQRRRESKKARGSADKGLTFPAKKEVAKANAKAQPTAPRKATQLPAAKGIPAKKK